MRGFRRFARLAAASFMLATMVPIAGVSATNASELDLAAALLAPDDAEEAGFEDYGVWSGWSFSDEDQMRGLEAEGWDEVEAREEIEGYGLRHTFYQTLLPIDENSAGTSKPTVFIQTVIQEYNTARDAREAYDAAEAVPEYEDAEHFNGAPDFGDESLVVRYVTEPEVDGIDYPLQTANVVFRSENVLTYVILTGVDNPVSEEDAIALAEIADRKVDGLLNGEDVGSIPAPNLVFFAPQFDEDGFCVCRNLYTIYDGEARALATDPVRTDGLQYLVDYFGVESQYLMVVKPEERQVSGVAMMVRISTFASEDEADFYVGDAIDWLEDGVTDYTAVESIDEEDFINFGDRSAAMTFETGGDPTLTQVENPVELVGTKLLVRFGTLVYEIDLFGVEQPEMETLEEVIEETMNCTEGGCFEQVEFPSEISTYLSEQAELAA